MKKSQQWNDEVAGQPVAKGGPCQQLDLPRARETKRPLVEDAARGTPRLVFCMAPTRQTDSKRHMDALYLG